MGLKWDEFDLAIAPTEDLLEPGTFEGLTAKPRSVTTDLEPAIGDLADKLKLVKLFANRGIVEIVPLHAPALALVFVVLEARLVDENARVFRARRNDRVRQLVLWVDFRAAAAI